jgi:hypothetical protein
VVAQSVGHEAVLRSDGLSLRLPVKEPLKWERHSAAINPPDELVMLLGHMHCGNDLPSVIDECDAL